MFNAYRLCPTAKSALIPSRVSLATTRASQSGSFSAGTSGDKIGPPKPRSRNATVQPSLQSQAPRAPDVKSPFTRTDDVSQLSKIFTRPAPNSVRSPNNADANTIDGGPLRSEQRTPSAAESSMQGLPSNASPSLDEREQTLTPDQCKEWTARSLAQDRIATGSDGGITLRKP
jgi:hypothetical protein